MKKKTGRKLQKYKITASAFRVHLTKSLRYGGKKAFFVVYFIFGNKFRNKMQAIVLNLVNRPRNWCLLEFVNV